MKVNKTAKAKAKKLQLKPKTPASGSEVRGVYVYFHAENRRWIVRLWDSSAKKLRYGGSFESKEAAEAKARELANKLKPTRKLTCESFQFRCGR